MTSTPRLPQTDSKPGRASGPFRIDPERHSRLLLQSQGPETTRRQIVRSLARVLSLVGFDVATYVTLRAAIRTLRDDALLGERVAGQVYAVFPLGSLKGIQFITALTIGLFLFGAYGRGDSRRDPVRIVKGVAFGTTLALWTSLWVQPPLLVLMQGTLITAVVWSAVAVGRQFYEYLIQFVFQTSPDTEPLVFIGDSADPDAAWVQHVLVGHQRGRRHEWVQTPGIGAQLHEPAERTIERLHRAMSAARAHSLVLCGDLPKGLFEAIVETASSGGIRVLTVTRVSGVVQRRTGFVWYNGTPFVELTVPGLRGWQLIAKRGLDLLFAGLGTVLLAPLFVLVAIAIKLDSAGPVFFRQERVGYAGRVFRVWKFRTMRETADQEKAAIAHLNVTGDQRLFKIPDDPRVTRIGAFLRRYSIDEFPQFFNVISGEMSLVGPRPFFPNDLRGYLDHHFARLGAKPGITGLWQIKGRSDVTDFEEVVRLDREYLDRWSLAFDLWILVRTIPVVLKGRGAY